MNDEMVLQYTAIACALLITTSIAMFCYSYAIEQAKSEHPKVLRSTLAFAVAFLHPLWGTVLLVIIFGDGS